MTERAEPPQNRRDQPPHQRAVAIGQRLQSGMRARAVELIVQGAVFMQHAVEDVEEISRKVLSRLRRMPLK